MTRLGDGDHESLAEIGQIQSCGSLLAFEEGIDCPSRMLIVCASEKVAEAPWIQASRPASEVLGKELGHVYHAEYVRGHRALSRQALEANPQAFHRPHVLQSQPEYCGHPHSPTERRRTRAAGW